MCEAVMLWRWPDDRHEPPVVEQNDVYSTTIPVVPYWHWIKCSPWRKTLWVKKHDNRHT